MTKEKKAMVGAALAIICAVIIYAGGKLAM